MVRNMDMETSAQTTDGIRTDAFETLLDDYNYQSPRRGELLEGEVLQVEERRIFVDVGLKRDAIVPEGDLERRGSMVKIQANGFNFGMGQPSLLVNKSAADFWEFEGPVHTVSFTYDFWMDTIEWIFL